MTTPLERWRARRAVRWLHHNADWYRIRYQLATLSMNRATATRDRVDVLDKQALADVDVLDKQALAETRAVARLTLRTIARLGDPRGFVRLRRALALSRSRVRADRALVAFLRTAIEPSALLLYAGALLHSGCGPLRGPREGERPARDRVTRELESRRPNPWLLVTFVEGEPELAPRVRYNLACFYTRVQRIQKDAEAPKEARRSLETAAYWLESAILRTPIAERPALFSVIRNDATLRDLLGSEAIMDARPVLGPVRRSPS